MIFLSGCAIDGCGNDDFPIGWLIVGIIALCLIIGVGIYFLISAIKNKKKK